MAVYIMLYACIIGLYFLFKKFNKGKLVYVITISIILSLLVGLRHYSMGLVDTEFVYMPRFYRISDFGWKYVLEEKDFLFQTLTYWFIQIFGDNFQLYLFLFGLPYIFSMGFIIYKYSNNPLLSFIIFVSLHYFEISFTLMRQVFGMGILLIALHYLFKKKYIKFVLLVVLSSYFHSICMIFLILLPLSFLKVRKWYVIPFVAILAMTLILPDFVMKFTFDNLVSSDRFSRYEEIETSKSLVLFLLNLVMWGVSLLAYKDIKQNKMLTILFYCSSLAVLISPLVLSLGEMSRVSYIFGISNVILLPYAFNYFSEDNEKILCIAITSAVFIAYFMVFLSGTVNINPYIPYFKV